MAEFDFIQEYRALQPSAPRETIEARAASHLVLFEDAPKQADRIVTLAKIAYKLPHEETSEPLDWFLEAVKASDPVFSLDHDKEEAAIIATLVLSNLIHTRRFGTPIVVLTGSLMGIRQSPGSDTLASDARELLAELMRDRGTSSVAPSVPVPKKGAYAEKIKAYLTEATEENGEALFSSVAADILRQASAVATSANAAIGSLHNENRRLAEEVDLLWWHLGGHSYLLDQPIGELSDGAKAIVIGFDVARLVNSLPGPYGAYGIIRKALGSNSSTKIKLSNAIKELGDLDFGKLDIPSDIDVSIAPIHGLTSIMDSHGQAGLVGCIKNKVGISGTTQMSHYDLALQAYHERLLIDQVWLK
ncbi:MAG: GTPase-associated system all-helical protein GASH [Halioglobus sp.]